MLRQVQRGGERATNRHRNLRRGQLERDALARDLDLQHRQQAHVARLIGEGGAFDVLHLPFGICGPVEHAEGIGQVIGVGGAILEIDQHRPLAIGAQAVHLHGEGLLGAEGRRVAAIGVRAVAVEAHLRREIDLVGHAVVVIVEVEGIGRAVAVGIANRAAQLGHIPDTHQLRAFEGVHAPVAVGVGVVGIEIPMLAGIVEAFHLHLIEDLIAVAVIAQRIGAQRERLAAILRPSPSESTRAASVPMKLSCASLRPSASVSTASVEAWRRIKTISIMDAEGRRTIPTNHVVPLSPRWRFAGS